MTSKLSYQKTELQTCSLLIRRINSVLRTLNRCNNVNRASKVKDLTCIHCVKEVDV